MSIDKMDSISTHVVMDEDLFEAAHREAKKRGITFSEVYRRALRRELKSPSLITEISDLRRDVDKLKELGTHAGAIAEGVEKNFELIKEVFELLKEHEELGH